MAPRPGPGLLGTLAVSGGKALLAALGFAIAVFLSRYLGPEDYGRYAAAIALVTLFAGLVQHAVDAAMLRLLPSRAGDSLGEARLFNAALALRMAGALTAVAVLEAGAAALRAAGVAPPVGPGAMALAGMAVAATILFSEVQLFFQAGMRFGIYLLLDVVLNLTRVAALGILGALAALDLDAALAVYAGSLLAASVAGFAWGRGAALARGGAAGLRAGMAGLVHAGARIGLAYALSLVQARLDLLLLPMLAGATAAGVYAAALNLALVVEFAGSFLLVVFYPRILPLAEAGQLRRVLLIFLAIAAPAAATLGLAGALWAGPLIAMVYGPEFAAAAPVFAVLLPAAACMLVVHPIAAPFLTLRNPRLLVKLEAVALGLTAAGLLMAIPAFGAMGAAAVTAAARVGVGAFILSWAVRHA